MVLLVAQLFAASIAGANGAVLENGSFDAPAGFSGWTTSPVSGAVGNGCSASDAGGATIGACASATFPYGAGGVSPEDGTYFALLKTNSGGGTRVSQSFHAGPGDKISGKTFFVAGPVFPDTATVEIKLGGAVISAPFSAVQAFGNPAFYTGWVEWSYEFQPGDLEADYTIVATVTNAIAPALSSWLGLDGITLETASVPEPTDTTPPDIAATVSGTPGDNGWYVSDVTVSYTASDDESGLDLTASDLGDDVLTAEGAGQSASGTAVDNAGNSATALVENIDIDKTAPVIDLPADQEVIASSAGGAVVSYSASADGSVSGLASLVSSPASGSLFAIGDTVVTHTATDIAGNVAIATHMVTVTNEPPVADAGLDQIVEWTAGGVVATLDGMASSDLDGHALTYTWTDSDGNIVGTDAEPTVNLSALGTYTFTLVVNDGIVDSGPDTVDVEVVDTTPPDVSAALVALDVEDDEGKYRAEFSCSDACDVDPKLTGVIVTPSLDGMEIKLKTKSKVKVVFEPAKNKVKIEGPDPEAILAQLQQFGGLVIDDGQQVQFELEDDDDGKMTFKFHKGVLKVEGPSADLFSLLVTCEDSSGNVGAAFATPEFSTEYEDDDDDDD